MLNQIVIAGRLVADPEITVSENNKKRTHITVAVPRSYKNMEGVYETDFIRCTLWNAIAESTCEYCKKGDIVGVKGRLQTSSYEDKDGVKKYTSDVIAEKVTFLSSKRPEETDE
jgi:single-strand DNA-binding protein